MQTISVIVPTHNSKREKKSCIEIVLRALLLQTLKSFEVVIVDNATNDDTLTSLAPLFDSFSERSVEVKVIRCEVRGNKCLARNMGAEAARNEILVFTDDDTVLTTNHALDFISNELRHHQFACGARRYWTLLHWNG